MKGSDETSSRRTMKSIYQNKLDAAFFAGRAAKTAYREYTVKTALRIYSQALEDALQSARYLDFLRQQLLKKFLELMSSSLSEKDESRAEKN